ncbi:MAG: hypothetical protein ACRDJO_04155 [Actinomycetota bacterium]
MGVQPAVVPVRYLQVTFRRAMHVRPPGGRVNMRLRFTVRRSIVAAAAMTVALGSAAAYANLDSLPGQATVDKVFQSVVEALDNVAGHIVGPGDPGKPPSDGKVQVPGTDIVPIPGVTTPAKAAAKPKPKAAPVAPAAHAEPAPLGDDPLEDIVKELTGPSDPAPGDDEAEEDVLGLDGLFEDPLVQVPDAKYGEGWNYCNNNNVKEIVNEGSSGTENTIEQNNSGNGEGDNDCS